MFDYTLRLLNNNINGHPKEYQKEVDFIIRMLKEGIGYLIRRGIKGETKVIFFEEEYNDDISCR